MSTSQRKLAQFAEKVGNPDHDVGNHVEPYKVLSDEFVVDLLKFVKCSSCDTVGESVLIEGQKGGLSDAYKLSCNHCRTIFLTLIVPL